MGKYIHWFDKELEFENKFYDDDYVNPWISYTEENEDLVYGPRDEEAAKWYKPLTFEILENGTIGWNCSTNVNNDFKTIQYNKNGKDWISITSSKTGAQISVRKGDVIQFRGDNGAYSTSSLYNYLSDDANINGAYNYFSSTCKFNVSGNITSLRDSTNYNKPVPGNAYVRLFYNCANLIDASKFRLEFNQVGPYAFAEMFKGCTSLTHIPEKISSPSCSYSAFAGMFWGCTSITEMPELDIAFFDGPEKAFTRMFEGCSNLANVKTLSNITFSNVSGTTLHPAFAYMFKDCTSIVNPPELPIVMLSDNWYRGMFKGCSSLTTAPILPATTLYNSCYREMFANCTSLTTAPTLLATVMKSWCYGYMFKGCTSLTTAPTLNAMDLAENCYYEMFYGCTNLTTTPLLPAVVLKTSCYSLMFSNSGLTSVPTISATTLANNCYDGMFAGCNGLTSIPNNLLPATNLTGAFYCYHNMFGGCTGIQNIPEGLLPATTLADGCYSNMFSGCTGLTSIPNGLLPATTLTDNCYQAMFQSCTGLTSLSSGLLPATDLSSASQCYYNMFDGCRNISAIPSNFLPATTLSYRCYYYMFSNCANLASVPFDLLPATNLTNGCYSYMFRGCSSLTSAPQLPATTLVDSCYSYMFYNCSMLSSVTCNAINQLENTYRINAWLSNVSSSGTFTINTSPLNWSRGEGGIPNGWTIIAPSGSLCIESTQIGINYIGQTIEVSNYTNTDFEIVSNSGSEWLTVTKTVDLQNYTYSLSFSADGTTSDRTATVVIKNLYNNETTNLTVRQLMPSISVDLNDQWVVDTNVGPNGETIYKSNSNYHVPDSTAAMYITIKGMNHFNLAVRTYGQSYYDYVLVSELDKTPQIVNNNWSNVKWNGSGNSSSSAYSNVNYTNIGYDEHVITVMYRKNSTTDSNDDRGYIYIPGDIEIRNNDFIATNSTGDTYHINGFATQNWTSSINSNSWITYSPTSGNAGPFDITVTISQNESDNRTETINLNCGSVSVPVTITQTSTDFNDYYVLPYIALKQNEYVDVGIINEPRFTWTNDAAGSIRVTFDSSVTGSDIGGKVILNDGNWGCSTNNLYVYSGKNATYSYSQWSQTGINWSGIEYDTVFILRGYSGSTYSDIHFKESTVRTAKKANFTGVTKPFNMYTSYWKIGGHFGQRNGITEPIRSIGVWPNAEGDMSEVYELKPYQHKATGKKMFMLDDKSIIYEVKTET